MKFERNYPDRFLLRDMSIYLHFDGLKARKLVPTQELRLSRSFCRLEKSSSEHTVLWRRMSSAKRFKELPL